MATRVAVIGAGPLGLMALKSLKEEGFDVTGYEARPYVGGLWKYSDDDRLSVGDGTVFNSSRYRSAFTDYPFPPDTDDYPTWQQMHRYLEGYCDHFDLRRHIHLSSPVTALDRHDDGHLWSLEISPPNNNSPSRRELYEKVVVASGSFVNPKSPHFDGIDKFAGPQTHALHFHNSPMYKGKNVLLIGFHATAQDVAVTLSRSASKVYISHRNGVMLLPRYSKDGAVFDTSQSLMVLYIQMFLMSWFPRFHYWLFDRLLHIISAQAFPNIPKSWNLSPAPSVATTSPLIADEIYPLLESGFAEPVSAIHRVTGPASFELKDGQVLNNVGAIVYCTGYDLCTPFISNEHNPYPTVGKEPNLYRGIFPLHADAKVRDSLAFLGHGAISFSGFAQHELIAMAISQVWNGKSSLPSFEDMQLWHRNWLAWRKDLLNKQASPAGFLTVLVPLADHIQWLDKAAGSDVFDHFGWFSSKAWSFWWRERALYKLCYTGLLSPAIWRLFESGKRKAWPKAREQLLQDNEDLKLQFQSRKKEMNEIETRKKK